MSRPRYHFPSWNYGYTLMPPGTDPGAGFPPPQSYGGFGPYHGGFSVGHGGGRMPFRGGFRGGQRGGKYRGGGGDRQEDSSQNKPEESSSKKEGDEGAKVEEGELVESQLQQPPPPPPPPPPPEQPQEESSSTSSRSLSEILNGRNPIMFCNDQSKFRRLRMEWEQVSETGPPHDKTFTWTLKMGDMVTTGIANSKKMAKSKAAEEMVKKLDALPKPQKRFYPQYPPMFHPGPPGNFYHNPRRMGMPPKRFRPDFVPQQPPEQAAESSTPAGGAAAGAAAGAATSAAAGAAAGAVAGAAAGAASAAAAVQQEQPNGPQNNPISKLYEYCKKRRLPEPLFETVEEKVLETRKTRQGFTLKKTEFTMQCSLQNKTFVGTAMTKKQAKFNAAAAAWAEFGVGVGQDSINSLLHTQRIAATSSK